MRRGAADMLDIADDHGIVRLTLARADVRNALDTELIGRLSETLDRLAGDASVRAIVVTGEGSAFSAGADLKMMRAMADADTERNRHDALEMGGLFHKVACFPRPVVARVNGPAIGGGVGLMAACDIVIAADSAFFAFSEVRLGIVPAVISPFCIRRLGPSAARRLFLTGERIEAVEARRLGLVDEVVAEADLDMAVERTTAQLRKGGPRALAEIKTLVSTVSELPDDQVLAHTAELIARLRATDEAREGMRAFLEKSHPAWTEQE